MSQFRKARYALTALRRSRRAVREFIGIAIGSVLVVLAVVRFGALGPLVTRLEADPNPWLHATVALLLCWGAVFSLFAVRRWAELGQEIDARQRAEQAAREGEKRYGEIFENAGDAVFTCDLKGRFTSMNQATERLIGYSRLEVIDRTLSSFVAPAAEPTETDGRPFWATTGLHECELVAKGGRRVPAEINTRIMYKDGKPVGVQGIARDINDRKRFEQQLIHLASHDPLTELFNRRRFEDELQLQLARAKRFATRGALLFLDLDHFKDVNDSLGHRTGDELLTHVALLLRGLIRETDVTARLGGDEFTVILPYAAATEARAVADKLLTNLQSHSFTVAGQPLTITASLGIALFPEHGVTAEELLSHADLAMYEAKQNGRNQISMYRADADWQSQIESRLAWRRRIWEALDKERFTLHAQPILDLRRNQISQYELLLRMIGDGGETIDAGRFIDNADRFGLIQSIDRWVVNQAIQLLAEHRRMGRELVLEVNLSGKALSDAKLLKVIERGLGEGGLNPKNLILEVTETAAISNLLEAQEFIRNLKAIGCRFALDDFGVGFSSFYQLKQLPVDFLKIDGSFIREVATSDVDQHLVRAIVELAHALNKETIAEFVGDQETVEVLREIGVDYAQGYHIGEAAELPTNVLQLAA